MTDSDPCKNGLNTRPYCPEDEFLIRLMKRGLRMLIRGMIATLLMLVDTLDDMAVAAVPAWLHESRAASPWPVAYAGGGWAFGMHHHGHGRHFHRAWGERHGFHHGMRGNAPFPAPPAMRTAVCCGDCRRCTEGICVKTGSAKKKAAA